MSLFKELLEAKKAQKIKPEFKKLTYSEFEKLSMNSEDYSETEIDGKGVLVHSKNGVVDALYYVKAKIGSFCANSGARGALNFSELDPNWPYGD